MRFEPQDWDLGPVTRIWALRLRFGPGAWGVRKEAEEGGEGKYSQYMRKQRHVKLLKHYKVAAKSHSLIYFKLKG